MTETGKKRIKSTRISVRVKVQKTRKTGVTLLSSTETRLETLK